MYSIQQASVVNDYGSFIYQWPWDHYATLTFGRKLSPSTCQRHWNEFIHSLGCLTRARVGWPDLLCASLAGANVVLDVALGNIRVHCPRSPCSVGIDFWWANAMWLGRRHTGTEYADSGCKNGEKNACSHIVVSSDPARAYRLSALGCNPQSDQERARPQAKCGKTRRFVAQRKGRVRGVCLLTSKYTYGMMPDARRNRVAKQTVVLMAFGHAPVIAARRNLP